MTLPGLFQASSSLLPDILQASSRVLPRLFQGLSIGLPGFFQASSRPFSKALPCFFTDSPMGLPGLFQSSYMGLSGFFQDCSRDDARGLMAVRIYEAFLFLCDANPRPPWGECHKALASGGTWRRLARPLLTAGSVNRTAVSQGIDHPPRGSVTLPGSLSPPNGSWTNKCLPAT